MIELRDVKEDILLNYVADILFNGVMWKYNPNNSKTKYDAIFPQNRFWVAFQNEMSDLGL